MKVVVLTTSYPREPGDPAGNFVADAVERVRERGVEVDVVSPASFRHFGIAYGAGNPLLSDAVLRCCEPALRQYLDQSRM